jgi:hypothetical protein
MSFAKRSSLASLAPHDTQSANTTAFQTPQLGTSRFGTPAQPQALDEKQELLVWLALSTLLNLAENAEVPGKLLARSMVSILAQLLRMPSQKMQQLVGTFLLRLSVSQEGVAQMRALGLVTPVVGMLASSSFQIIDVALRLLHNLSFDESAREEMVGAGAIDKVSKSPLWSSASHLLTPDVQHSTENAAGCLSSRSSHDGLSC